VPFTTAPRLPSRGSVLGRGRVARSSQRPGNNVFPPRAGKGFYQHAPAPAVRSPLRGAADPRGDRRQSAGHRFHSASEILRVGGQTITPHASRAATRGVTEKAHAPRLGPTGRQPVAQIAGGTPRRTSTGCREFRAVRRECQRWPVPPHCASGRRLDLSAVRFLGERRDVAALLGPGGVIRPPSYTEGISLALLEAMPADCLRSPRGSRHPRSGERRQRGRGLVCPLAAALAGALGELCRDPEQSLRLGQRGRRVEGT